MKRRAFLAAIAGAAVAPALPKPRYIGGVDCAVAPSRSAVSFIPWDDEAAHMALYLEAVRKQMAGYVGVD